MQKEVLEIGLPGLLEYEFREELWQMASRLEGLRTGHFNMRVEGFLAKPETLFWT